MKNQLHDRNFIRPNLAELKKQHIGVLLMNKKPKSTAFRVTLPHNYLLLVFSN